MSNLYREAISYDHLRGIEDGKGAYEFARFFNGVLKNYLAFGSNRPASFVDYLAEQVAKSYGLPLSSESRESASSRLETLRTDEVLLGLKGVPLQETLFISPDKK